QPLGLRGGARRAGPPPPAPLGGGGGGGGGGPLRESFPRGCLPSRPLAGRVGRRRVATADGVGGLRLLRVCGWRTTLAPSKRRPPPPTPPPHPPRSRGGGGGAPTHAPRP